MSAATQAIKAYQDALAGETSISDLWNRYIPLTVDEIDFIIAEAKAVRAGGVVTGATKPDYFLKIIKQSDEWFVYQDGGRVGPYVFTEIRSVSDFVRIHLFAAEQVSNLKSERDKLDAQIKELESYGGKSGFGRKPRRLI